MVIVTQEAINDIGTFYGNVAKRYPNTWDDQQWWQFFSRGGTLTHEEFCLKLDKIIQDVYGD